MGKIYEILGEQTYINNNEDFFKCEPHWVEMSENEVFRHIALAKEIADEMNDSRPYLEENNAREILDSGELILLPLFFVREKNDNPKCPLCGRSYTDYPALSRIDNKTHICPKCGTKEALESMGTSLNL